MSAVLYTYPLATSEQTAIVVPDYPYGFRLRCTMLHWIEYKPGKGFRHVTRTSNPKRPGTWNKPKAGTYCFVAMCLYDEEGTGHIHAASLTGYETLAEAEAFQAKFTENMSEQARGSLALFLKCKRAHDARIANDTAEIP